MFRAIETHLEVILPYRRKYLKESNFQIRYNNFHESNWTDSYLLFDGNKIVGYGAVKGLNDIKERNTIFEFYLLKSQRHNAQEIYNTFIAASNATYAEAQSNDILNTEMLNTFCKDITNPLIIFGRAQVRANSKFNAKFRLSKTTDTTWKNKEAELEKYVLEIDNTVVAGGGFTTHYNKYYADIFMEVKPSKRKRGLGSFIVQSLIKECQALGLTPVAACSIENEASKNCLLKGGFLEIGHTLQGTLKV